MYTKIQHRFWYLQPVFHFYDFYYWFVNAGVIRTQLPDKNRYVNLLQIETLDFTALTPTHIDDFTRLVRLNYLRNGDNTFSPKKEHIMPYFYGHNSPCFCSFYLKPQLLMDTKTNTTIDDKKLVGVMTSRPLHVQINSSSFDVYYIDYLCVYKQHRKQNIAPQLIQTHEYIQSHTNKKISVSLFKREEELTGIIPLTVYKSYCFRTSHWISPEQFEPRYQIITGDKQNINYLYTFLNTIHSWNIVILPEISNMMELLSTKNIIIKILVVDGNIEAVYMFRNSCIYISKGEAVLTCFATVKSPNLSVMDFIKGFKIGVFSVLTDNPIFKFVLMEDISDSRQIIKNLSLKTIPMSVSSMAYFFYNFAHSPFKSSTCLIIN